MTEATQPSSNGSVNKAEAQKREDDDKARAMSDQHRVNGRIGKLEAMAAFFDTEASRARGRKLQKRAFNKALDKALDEDEPDMTDLRAQCRKAVVAKRAGLLDQFEE